ncbi:hypothetical protein BD408DRAFT_418442 [Parasitella parasitica]|nr:hypothetical protein BD408DRAFT_418442 [Parasitella parasitica]
MAHDTYELPSIYTRQPPEQIFADSEDEDDEQENRDGRGAMMASANSALPSRSNPYKDVHAEDNRLAWLMLGAAFFTLLMTIIPVVCDLPNPSFWFTGDALWRFFDPLITLPLNLFIITRADIMTSGRSHYWGALSEASVTWLLWTVGAGMYCQFHGVHTASALFKHPIQDFNEAHPELVLEYPILHEMYLNMQTTWEHYIAHYLYAGGAMIMSWVQLFAFRNQIHGPLPSVTKAVWCIGSVIYGLLLAGVAIEFPHGLIVGLVYTIVIGLICVFMMVFNRKNLPRGGLFTMGRRMVIQYYLGACVLGLVIILIWIGKYGLLNRKAAGVAV